MGELLGIWNLAEPGVAGLGELLGARSVASSLELSKNPLKLRLVRESTKILYVNIYIYLVGHTV